MAIIVGTDLSETALEALRAAFALAAKRGDEEVFLVHVLGDEEAHDAGTSGHKSLGDDAKKRLDADAAKFAAGTKIKVRTEVLMGGGEAALMAFAETEQAELLIVTSKGEGGGGSLRKLGTSAERLAVRATVPLLVVRDAEPFMAWASGERRLKVLVGVDDSAACEGAIQLVKALRGFGAIDIVVGHVYFPDEAAKRYGMRSRNMVEATPEIEKLLLRDLTRRLGAVPGDGEITIGLRLGLGRVGDHMLETADAHKVDLIVVGTHRKAGLKRLSSVSAVILHDAQQSVLCVPLSADTALDHVPTLRVAVAATDRSAFGNRAIPYAYALVGERGEVHIVHIVEDENDTDDQAVVEELLDMAPPSRMSVTTRAHVVHGDNPAQTIAETAERLGADVVVIASHGRSGISRALVGSVADKLMRACHRPVLVLRPVE
jgi:nucleotide-binding universal stress UspA family protein